MPINPTPQPVDVVINPSNESPKVKDFIVNAPLIVQSINVKTKFDSLDSTTENLSQRVVILEARPLGNSGSPSGDYVPTSRTVNTHALTSDITITKSDLGLANVDNTSDSSKPVSTAQAAADVVVLSAANAYTDAHGGGGVAQPAYDFTSATGLTPFLGTAGNTITVGGGVAAIYSPAAAGMLRFDQYGYGFLSGPALYRNFDTPVAEFDVATRVLAPAGYADGNCRYGIEVATLGSFVTVSLPRQRFTYNADTGALYWEDQTGFQAYLAGAVPLDGTGWLRIQLIGTFMTFWLGISAGNVVPTTWTMKKRFIPTAALYESVCVSLQIGGSMPTPTTANFGALAVLLPATL